MEQTRQRDSGRLTAPMPGSIVTSALGASGLVLLAVGLVSFE